MIDDLKSAIGKGGGLAFNNRFNIRMFAPGNVIGNLRDVSLLCESTSIPGRQITSFEYPLFVYRHEVKVPNGYMNEDIEVSLLLTNDFSIKKAMEDWSDLVIDKQSYTLNYLDKYAGTVVLTSLNQRDERNFRVTLYNAWPITINSMELNNTSTNDYLRLPVTFTYEDFGMEFLAIERQ